MAEAKEKAVVAFDSWSKSNNDVVGCIVCAGNKTTKFGIAKFALK